MINEALIITIIAITILSSISIIKLVSNNTRLLSNNKNLESEIKSLKGENQILKESQIEDPIQVGRKAIIFNYPLTYSQTKTDFKVDYEVEIIEVSEYKVKVNAVNFVAHCKVGRDPSNQRGIINFLQNKWVSKKEIELIMDEATIRDNKIKKIRYNMSNIRKVNDKTVIDILKDLTDQIVASGEADERDSDALYHLGLDIMNWKNIKRNWKTRFAEISEYIHDIDDKTAQTLYDAEAENLETLKLSDDIWEFNAFSDSYEGCRVSLTSDGDKLKLVSWEVIDEEECEVEGISDSKIYKLLN